MLNKLLRSKVRVIIPFKSEDATDYIEIRNPEERVIKHVKERVINRINGKDEFDNGEMIEYLIKELTNVSLEESLDVLLSSDISHECKMLLYHVTDIYNEIQTEILSVIRMEIASKRIVKLEEDVVVEMQQV